MCPAFKTLTTKPAFDLLAYSSVDINFYSQYYRNLETDEDIISKSTKLGNVPCVGTVC